ncbi:MAG TPA: condensation domain-containing protein, partial [Alphaproteobacteria bacterium]|nr:condensation domain-containing protein [Alphaproteobacteria bacterium]
MRQADIINAYKAGKLSTTELKGMLRELASQTAKTPLSEGQRGLWMLHKLHPDMSAYNVPICFRVGCELDPERLRDACAVVLEQFPILTSVVEEERGAPFLVPRPSSAPCFQCQSLSPSLTSAQVLDHLRQVAKTPFALQHGPLLRVHLFTRPRGAGQAAEQLVLLIVHHIIFDGSSLLPVLTTLLDAYLALRAGKRPILIPATCSYGEFVAWEQEMMASPEGREHLAYWQHQLAGPLPVLDLFGRRPRWEIARRFEGRTHTRPLSAELSREIWRFAQSHQCNPSVVFLALFKLLLYRYSGQDDLIVGIPTMVRPEERFEALVGYFVNMIAVRSQVDGGRSFLDLMHQVELTLVDGLDHSAYPFVALLRSLHVPQARGHAPVFQVCFAYQNFVHRKELEGFGRKYAQPLSIEFVEGIHQEGEFELTLEVVAQHDRFVLNLKYDPELYDTATMERMLGHLMTLAAGVLQNPARALDAYALLPPEEAAQLLASLSPPARQRAEPGLGAGTKAGCLHQVFAAQARATPDAVAVTCDGQALTYGALERRSTLLARALQQQGVGPECLVGLS